MNFVKLTLFYLNKPIYIACEHITMLRESAGSKNTTLVWVGEDQDYIEVTETVSEVLELIKLAKLKERR